MSVLLACPKILHIIQNVKLAAVTSFITQATFFSLSLILSFEEEILVRLKLGSLVTFLWDRENKTFYSRKN